MRKRGIPPVAAGVVSAVVIVAIIISILPSAPDSVIGGHFSAGRQSNPKIPGTPKQIGFFFIPAGNAWLPGVVFLYSVKSAPSAIVFAWLDQNNVHQQITLKQGKTVEFPSGSGMTYKWLLNGYLQVAGPAGTVTTLGTVKQMANMYPDGNGVTILYKLPITYKPQGSPKGAFNKEVIENGKDGHHYRLLSNTVDSGQGFCIETDGKGVCSNDDIDAACGALGNMIKNSDGQQKNDAQTTCSRFCSGVINCGTGDPIPGHEA